MKRLLLLGGLASLGYALYRVWEGSDHIITPIAGTAPIATDRLSAIGIAFTDEKDFFWLPAGLLVASRLL